MLTEILAILELLLTAVKGERTPDKQRQRFAKNLLKLHSDIDDIVDRGRRLLSMLDGTKPVVVTTATDVIQSQQIALQNLAEHLKGVEPVLRVHLPLQSIALRVLWDFKRDDLVLILQWLLTAPNLDKDDERGTRFTLPAGYADLTPSEGLESAPEWYTELAWMSLEPKHLDIRSSERSGIVIVALPSDVERGTAILNRLAEIQEELRRFMVERFKLEDLL